jgi:hypothetical protein
MGSIRINTGCALLLCFLASVSGVLAHIPETSWLMAHMAEKRLKLGLRQLKVEMTCGPDENHQKDETLFLKLPRKVRRELADKSLEVCVANKCQSKTNDQPAKASPPWSFLQYLYFVESNQTQTRYMNLLRSLNIDVRVNTLTRAGNRVAVIVGAKEWEQDRPQLWLDKDLYLPLRLMVLYEKSIIEFRWIQWGSRVSGDWYPARVEIRKEGNLLQTCTTQSVEVNRPMPAALFKKLS